VITEIQAGTVIKAPDLSDKKGDFAEGDSEDKGKPQEFKVAFYEVALFKGVTVRAQLAVSIPSTASRLKTLDQVMVAHAEDGIWYIFAVIQNTNNGVLDNPRLDKKTEADEYHIANPKTGGSISMYPGGIVGFEASKRAKIWSIPGVDALSLMGRRAHTAVAAGDVLLLQDDETKDVAMRTAARATTDEEAGRFTSHVGAHKDKDVMASMAIHKVPQVKAATVSNPLKKDPPWAGKWDGADRADWKSILKMYKDGTVMFQSTDVDNGTPEVSVPASAAGTGSAVAGAAGPAAAAATAASTAAASAAAGAAGGAAGGATGTAGAAGAAGGVDAVGAINQISKLFALKIPEIPQIPSLPAIPRLPKTGASKAYEKIVKKVGDVVDKISKKIEEITTLAIDDLIKKAEEAATAAAGPAAGAAGAAAPAAGAAGAAPAKRTPKLVMILQPDGTVVIKGDKSATVNFKQIVASAKNAITVSSKTISLTSSDALNLTALRLKLNAETGISIVSALGVDISSDDLRLGSGILTEIVKKAVYTWLNTVFWPNYKTHIHSNGNNGAPTGVPIVLPADPPTEVLAVTKATKAG
jgi:hypothetical protein